MQQKQTIHHNTPEPSPPDVPGVQASESGNTENRRQLWAAPRLTILNGIHQTQFTTAPTS